MCSPALGITDACNIRGELVGEEALYAKTPVGWGGGGNLHRTPFGGRNGEYWSEDSIMVYLDNLVELSAAQKKGFAQGVKHVAGNDQELYREGLNMFFNEQAFREGALKGRGRHRQQRERHRFDDVVQQTRCGLVLSQHRADHSGDPQRMGL